MPKREVEDVVCHIRGETDKAIRIDDGTKQAWLPKSQVEYEQQPDGTFVVTAPIWLLKEKGLL